MKVVLDTNVLVSGSFWTGDSFKVLQLIDSGKLELFLSEELVKEYDKIIGSDEIVGKIVNKNLIMNSAVKKIIKNSKLVEPKQMFDIVKEDADDNKIIECAVEGQVDYIISQDKHLLNLKEFKCIKIITPEKFLDIFGERQLHDILMDSKGFIPIEDAIREANKRWLGE